MRVSLAIAVTLMTSAAAAAPPAAERTVEIAPYAGYRGGGTFKDGPTENDLDVDESASFGLTISRSLDSGRRVELWYGHQSSNIAEGGAPLFDLDIQYLHVGGTVAIDETNVFHPFVSGGIGLAYFDPGRSGLGSETRPSLSLGVGAKAYLLRNVGVRLDARWIGALMDNNSAVFCADGSCAVRVDGSLFSQWEIGAGVFVAF